MPRRIHSHRLPMLAAGRRSRAAFDESVESIDAETRARLSLARARALEKLEMRRLSGAALWIPAGAAAASLALAHLWQRERELESPLAELAALQDLELMTHEDFDLLQEEEGFYVWVEEQMADGVG